MDIQDPGVIRLIERIGDHYRANIASRFIRPVLLQLPVDKQCWDLIEDLTDKAPLRGSVQLHEAYRQIAAAAAFVSLARQEASSGLRRRAARSDVSPQDRVLRDMAVNAFESNLQVFADLTNELFVKLVEADKAAARGRKPVYLQMPELHDIGKLLVGG
ncbi:MAG: hypothetical protein LBD31_03980 [Treponema sp.]|jgi:hypothetical protein|nr:hypothetical protein [Treponema sp.]